MDKKQGLLEKKVFLALLVVTASLLTIVLSVCLPNHSVLAANNRGKQLRTLSHYRFKPVCSSANFGQARCLSEVSVNATGQPQNGVGGFGPAQFHKAYNLPCMPGGSVAAICSLPPAFGPETIAIVDAGNFSTGSSGLQASLSDYDSNFGLPSCSITNGCLSVFNQSGNSSPLPADAGWSGEIALDVETAHMVCQTCKIALIEANDSSVLNLASANTTAANLKPVAISNSWGSSTDASALDSDFTYTGIAEVAATGDSGSMGTGAAWPAEIPDVLAVSGTTLQIFNDNTWSGETVWSNSGGGCSSFYSAPSWQTSRSDWGANGCGAYRALGDLSVDGDPNSGAAVNINGSWFVIGGTSLSSPLIASMFALAGGVQVGTTASSIPYSLFTSLNSHDIISGNDCTYGGEVNCTASTGFDTPSGLGTPNGIAGLVTLMDQPTGFSLKLINQNEIDLSWQSSSGATGYYIYRNNSKIASVSTTTYKNTSLSPNTTYQYYVVAHDNSGNLSIPTSVALSTTYYPEDINEDKHINLLDLSILASKYGKSGSSVGRADVNGDGTVNLLDLSLLASKYGSE